jgi:hypothetical protein
MGESIIGIPPPPEPPYDIETMEPINVLVHDGDPGPPDEFLVAYC